MTIFAVSAANFLDRKQNHVFDQVALYFGAQFEPLHGRVFPPEEN
jgi:hypothetical protein